MRAIDDRPAPSFERVGSLVGKMGRAERRMVNDQIRLDHERRRRLGFDEAIFAAGKTGRQLVAILDQAAALDRDLLLTRLTPEAFAGLPEPLQAATDYDALSATGFFNWRPQKGGASSVAIVTAGSSDVRVAAEAERTLAFNGIGAETIHDVGVAGLWRLVERIDDLKGMAVVIVAAGMDGALPSVVGGLVPGVVIAVPTSVGYGAARAGETALHAALASCAPGLLVCNIDNGYGAACAALRVLQARAVEP
jgi:NCAIR mutase (PurE)-related protein